MALRTEPVEGYKLVISKKLDEYLQSHKITNKEFGEVFNVTEGAIRYWRSGLCSMDINKIVKLCEYWNITIYELLDIKDPSSLSPLDRARLRKINDNPALADIIDNYSKK